MTPAPMFISHN